jgi:hypothetical protein
MQVDSGHFERATRVMCKLAHGPAPTPKHHAAHSCGKGHEACINPKHLRWATPRENAADAKLHGTFKPPPSGGKPWSEERKAKVKLRNHQRRMSALMRAYRETRAHELSENK